jgi:hypothetical protein
MNYLFVDSWKTYYVCEGLALFYAFVQIGGFFLFAW